MKNSLKIFKLFFAIFVLAITIGSFFPGIEGIIGLTVAAPLVLASLKTSDDAKKEKRDILNRMDEMIQTRKKEQRTFTDKEQREYNEHRDNLKKLNEYIDQLMDEEKRALEIATIEVNKRKANNPGRYNAAPTNEDVNKNVKFYDSRHGTELRSYTRDQSIFEETRKGYDDEQQNMQFGRLVRGKITDRWENAQAEKRAVPMSTADGASVLHPVIESQMLDAVRSLSVLTRAQGVQTLNFEGPNVIMAKINDDPIFESKAENAAFTAREVPAGDVFDMKPFTIGTVVYTSREYAEDAADFFRFVELSVQRGLAAEIDRLFLFGAGTTEPLGITNISGINEVVATGSLEYPHITEAWSKIANNNFEPNTFAMNPRDMYGLTEVSKGSLGYWGRPELLKNVDFLHSGVFPTNLGTGTDESIALLGDFRHVVVGIREGIRIETTTVADDTFKKHQYAIKVWMRGDVALLRPKAVTKITGLTEYSAT
jgi:HK97 family phage major capsid protein